MQENDGDRELMFKIHGEYVRLLRLKVGMDTAQLSYALERESDFLDRVEKGEILLPWEDFRDAVLVLGGDLLEAMGECTRAFAAEKKIKPKSADDPGSKRIARSVWFLRRSKGMSQRELSLAIGRKPSYISSVERNGSRLDVEALIQIAEVCGVDPEAWMREIASDWASVHRET